MGADTRTAEDGRSVRIQGSFLIPFDPDVPKNAKKSTSLNVARRN